MMGTEARTILFVFFFFLNAKHSAMFSSGYDISDMMLVGC